LNKGDGVINILNNIDVNLSRSVAVGDSVNDVSVFEIVEQSFAVANADSAAKDAASDVLNEPQAKGTISALNRFI
jgi:hydroxymethylpyrimidine pyrophosphatase-like HAD family hydrolase